MNTNKNKAKMLGDIGEKQAKIYLQNKGYKIITTNYHSRYGEIDIIAKNQKYIIFVEVKARKLGSMVNPIEAVNYPKRLKIIKTASEYLYKNNIDLQPRFDIIAILNNSSDSDITHIENAFGMEE